MKNVQKILLFMVFAGLFIMLASKVSAQSVIYNQTLLAWYPHGNLTRDNSSAYMIGSFNSQTNQINYSTGVKKVGEASGYFDGANADDAIIFGNGGLNNGFERFKNVQNFSVCAWTNYSTSPNFDHPGNDGFLASRIDADGTTSGDWLIDYVENPTQVRFIYDSQGTGTTFIWGGVSAEAHMFTSHYEQFCLVINGTANAIGVQFYINSSLVQNLTSPISIGTTNGDFIIGNRLSSPNAIKAGIDNLYFFNFSLSQANVTYLYNSGDGREIGNSTSIDILNVSPTIAINLPLNNSQTHNKTAIINFTITAGTNNNISFQTWLDTNPNPITLINSTNTTQGTFVFFYSIVNEISGSINGTYYLKVNGTDNTSNIFANIFSFNLTNNISNYVTTNITIIPSALSPGSVATGHCNITSKSSEENNQSMTNRLWYINQTQLTTNVNSTTLAGTNVTLNANITFSCRINNGYGETSWTNFTNSSMISVGDVTTPQVLSLLIDNKSITTSDTNIFRFSCADVSSNLQKMNFTLVYNGSSTIHKRILKFTSGGFGSLSVGESQVNLQTQNYIWNYTIFKTDETILVGLWNITEIGCSDTSNNNIYNITTENLNFNVTASSGSGGGSSGAGSGGGGVSQLPPQIIIQNVTLPISNCNFNKICENGEDPFGCSTDCKINTDYLFCDDPSKKCIKDTISDYFNLFNKRDPIFRISIILVILTIAIVFTPKDSAIGRIFKKPFLKRNNNV